MTARRAVRPVDAAAALRALADALSEVDLGADRIALVVDVQPVIDTGALGTAYAVGELRVAANVDEALRRRCIVDLLGVALLGHGGRDTSLDRGRRLLYEAQGEARGTGLDVSVFTVDEPVGDAADAADRARVAR